MSDPRKYRTKEEEQHEESNDCIAFLEQFLSKEHGVTADSFKQMTRQVKTQVRHAVEWAKKSPETPTEELYKDVFTDQWGPYTGTSLPDMLEERGIE
jgi:TPP-dependent pyruvate/acetoin dehydrogenase alpha subunit